MPENTNKVIQLQDTEGNDVSPVVNVGSIYDKNGQKIDNLLSYVVAGTDVPIPEINDVVESLQELVNTSVSEMTTQIENKLTEIDTTLDGIDELIASSISENIVFGTYTGDGSGTTSKSINLGFRPKAVIVFSRAGTFGSNNESSSGMAIDGYSCMSSSYTGISITGSGFTVYTQGINYGNGVMFASNDGDLSPYRYVAWR